MHVSKRVDYAARAVLDLSQRYGMGPARTSEIARRQRIPASFLEQIMTALRKAGIVRSSRGPRGGHQLALPPADLTLRAVVDAVEGRDVSSSSAGTEGSASAPSGVLQEVWCELEDAEAQFLVGMTYDSLVRRITERENRVVYSI